MVNTALQQRHPLARSCRAGPRGGGKGLGAVAERTRILPGARVLQETCARRRAGGARRNSRRDDASRPGNVKTSCATRLRPKCPWASWNRGARAHAGGPGASIRGRLPVHRSLANIFLFLRRYPGSPRGIRTPRSRSLPDDLEVMGLHTLNPGWEKAIWRRGKGRCRGVFAKTVEPDRAPGEDLANSQEVPWVFTDEQQETSTAPDPRRRSTTNRGAWGPPASRKSLWLKSDPELAEVRRRGAKRLRV